MIETQRHRDTETQRHRDTDIHLPITFFNRNLILCFSSPPINFGALLEKTAINRRTPKRAPKFMGHEESLIR
jgi:hypothetical protein